MAQLEAERAITLRGALLALAALLLIALIGAFTLVNSADVSENELARRCAESNPRWDSYQEDTKGMIGARPTAEWKGAPLSIATTEHALTIRFIVEEPWATRPFGIPILVKLPTGEIAVLRGTMEQTGQIAYAVEASDSNTRSLPWLELQYPHHRERLPLDVDGSWSR